MNESLQSYLVHGDQLFRHDAIYCPETTEGMKDQLAGLCPHLSPDEVEVIWNQIKDAKDVKFKIALPSVHVRDAYHVLWVESAFMYTPSPSFTLSKVCHPDGITGEGCLFSQEATDYAKEHWPEELSPFRLFECVLTFLVCAPDWVAEQEPYLTQIVAAFDRSWGEISTDSNALEEGLVAFSHYPLFRNELLMRDSALTERDGHNILVCGRCGAQVSGRACTQCGAAFRPGLSYTASMSLPEELLYYLSTEDDTKLFDPKQTF